MHRRAPGESQFLGYGFVAPALVVYSLFVLLPLGQVIRLSFFSWDGITAQHWVGLANYRAIFSNALLRSAFEHSLVLIAFYSFIPVVIGFVLATIVLRVRIRGQGAFRAILFLPQIIPTVAYAIAWQWIYAGNGPLNHGLKAIGLGSVTRAWLGDFTWALPAVGIVGAWANYGLVMVLFVAAVQKIPTSLYEAARVDGAGVFREFWAVTFPNLRGELAVALVLTAVSALRGFDLVYVMTRGGPGTSTTVPGFQIFQYAFGFGQFGIASAMGVTLAVIIIAVVALIRRVEVTAA